MDGHLTPFGPVRFEPESCAGIWEVEVLLFKLGLLRGSHYMKKVG